MSDSGDGWDSAVSAWAHAQGDIRALVQIGSRVQTSGNADSWSDYDYQLISSHPEKYHDGSFAAGLGRCWAYGASLAFGNAVKVSAVFDGALEADFVVLRHFEVVLATLALRWPGTSGLWPRRLKSGVTNLRIVVGPGWKMIKGGNLWEKRYSRITPERPWLTEAEFRGKCGEFWTQLVWVAKKVERGEFRAGQRGFHEHLLENTFRILQEEARLEGRQSYPLARRAERWLTPEQIEATSGGTRPDRDALIAALRQVADMFSKSCAAVSTKTGWQTRDNAEVRAWLAGLFDEVRQ
jgi:hypothetical protein